MIRCLSAVCATIGLLATANAASAFGTKRAHQDLALESIVRSDRAEAITRYLQTDLDLLGGLREPLAIQFGLDPAVDEDLIVGDDPATRDLIETRLNRSLSRLDEDENGKLADRPLAPGRVRVFFQRNCREALDFDTCLANLPRADVRQLIQIGTYAEDNPNPRAQHHFHDPERSHGLVGHGLDNAHALTPSLVGTRAIAEGLR